MCGSHTTAMRLDCTGAGLEEPAPSTVGVGLVQHRRFDSLPQQLIEREHELAYAFVRGIGRRLRRSPNMAVATEDSGRGRGSLQPSSPASGAFVAGGGQASLSAAASGEEPPSTIVPDAVDGERDGVVVRLPDPPVADETVAVVCEARASASVTRMEMSAVPPLAIGLKARHRRRTVH